MGLIEKINYTLDAINDISLALKEKGINIDPVVLKDYGDIIRTLRIGNEDEDNLITIKPIVKEGYTITHLTTSITDKAYTITDNDMHIVKEGYSAEHIDFSISNSYAEIEMEE